MNYKKTCNTNDVVQQILQLLNLGAMRLMRIKRKKFLSVALGTVLGAVGSVSYLGLRSLHAESALNGQFAPSNTAVAQSSPVSLGATAVSYQTTDDLLATSNLVVCGKFTGKPLLSPLRRGPDLPTASSEDREPPARDPNLIYQRDPGHRDLAFVVQEVLKGDKTTKQIFVGQRGAIDQITTADTVRSVEGDTLFKPGDSYILFLVKPLPHETKLAGREFYWVAGAVQGAYRLKNKKVYSRNVELAQPSPGEEPVSREIEEYVGPKVEGVPEEAFLSELRAKIK